MTTDAAAAAAAAGEDSLGGLDKVETFPVPPPAEAEVPSSSSSSSAAAAILLALRVSVLLGIDRPMQVKSVSKEKEEEKGKESDDDDGSFDLVLVHLTAEAFSSEAAADADADEKIDASKRALSFADSFLKHARSAPGALDDRGDDALLVAVVFSGSGDEEGEDAGGEELPSLSLPLPPRGGAPLPLLPVGSSCPVPRPAQSFEFAEGYRMEPGRRGSGGRGGALLVASRCDGVLRADGARQLLECKRRSGNGNENDTVEVVPGGNGMGCVLAEHLLDEVSYKTGRALKYGA